MAYTMYGMPFANQITPMHQISNTPFYGMPHQPSISSYYPGTVSYGLPFAPQPFVGVNGNSFVSNVGHSENPMFYTQYAKTASSSSMTSTDLVKARKGIDSKKDQSKENVSSQTKTSPVKVKTSEESTIRQAAQQWSYRQGFSPSQIQEFDHLMKIALSKWIPKRQLTGSVQIDSGSFGKIYRSTYRDSEVAVKEISQSSSLKSKMKDISFELDALILCNHPCVVRFHGSALDFSQHSYQPSIALVFELCENGSLHKNLFEKRRVLNARQKVLIGSQVAGGLAYLHSRHILHRDLNTRNVLLASDFSAKIADFGCARMLSKTTGRIYCPEILGSPAYMSPEQMQSHELSAASDVWALAMLLWEMLTESKPWEGIFHDFEGLRSATLRGARVPMPASTGRFPKDYVGFIRSGTRTLPHDRPTALEIQGTLEAAAAAMPQ